MSPKCLHIERIASKDHKILNQIMVGKVFTVEDQIKDRLDIRANIYSHQNCLPSKSPGKMIAIFVMNAINSTVFGLSQ
jgi:hypothetical protein